MAQSQDRSKKKPQRLTAKEKRAAQYEANRAARRQWMILGLVLAVIIIAVVVGVSIFTEGELPIQQGIPEP